MKNTEIYLNGTKPYRREYDIITRINRKSDFAQLLENRDSATVYLDKSTAKKYAVAILRLGYLIVENISYDMFTIRIKVEKIHA